jgi:hypothetical protein
MVTLDALLYTIALLSVALLLFWPNIELSEAKWYGTYNLPAAIIDDIWPHTKALTLAFETVAAVKTRITLNTILPNTKNPPPSCLSTVHIWSVDLWKHGGVRHFYEVGDHVDKPDEASL